MTLSRPRKSPANVLAVTSGKGGVGKTNVAINLAVALARQGHAVGMLDADFGLGNVDVLLGLTPPFHLGHVLSGDKRVEDVMVDGPLGIRIVPAGTGIRDLTALGAPQWRRVRELIHETCADLDYFIIDTAAGVSSNVVELLLAAGRVLVVTSPEPTAVVDAYAVVKIMTAADPSKELGLVLNGVRDPGEASLVFGQLDTAARRFLSRELRFYGFIVEDRAVRDAVLAQRPIVDQMPQAPASRCFRALASRLAGGLPGGGGMRIVARGPEASIGAPRQEASRCA
jgi:flagellar biosynthesis protein FlhG